MRKGQALVIVLLILAVALTVGLSVVSRTVTEVSVSTVEEESSRALSAAEAGIEAALVGQTGTGLPVGITGGTYTSTRSDYGNSTFVQFSEAVRAGETVSVLLSSYSEASGQQNVPPSGVFSGNLDICWGDPAKIFQTPAMEVILYYYNTAGSSYRIKRLAYDPAGRSNGFAGGVATGLGGCSGNYKYKVGGATVAALFGLGAGDSPMVLRLRLLYNDTEAHTVAVGGSTTFPVQGKLISSTGQAGQATRKVQIFEQFPDLPDVFDGALFSGFALDK